MWICKLINKIIVMLYGSTIARKSKSQNLFFTKCRNYFQFVSRKILTSCGKMRNHFLIFYFWMSYSNLKTDNDTCYKPNELNALRGLWWMVWFVVWFGINIANNVTWKLGTVRKWKPKIKLWRVSISRCIGRLKWEN